MLKYNNLVSVTIDKLTNELTGFIKLTDDKEVKQILPREECLQKHFNFGTSYSRYHTISASLGEREEAEDGIERFIFLYI